MDLAENLEPEAGEKRPIENGEVSVLKRQRCGTPGGMKRVAEIVLVLSAMAKMRGGGRDPTDAELGLMAEAREGLVEICEGLAPKDIAGRDAIGAVIEDLGLNAKQKEMKLGFRMPRLTISERLSIAKKKIEESKKFQASAAQPLQTGVAASSTPMPHHLSTSEVRASTVTSALPGSHFGRDSSSFNFARPQVNSSLQGSAAHSLVNAPTWSIQSQPGGLTKPGQENKALNHNSAKFEGPDVSMSSRMTLHGARDQTYRPFITQSSSGTLPAHSVSHVQIPPAVNNHNEIVKIVQKILQPKVPEHPTWTPPSREYMTKSLDCQTCKLAINEVETVLICDACEHGFHLKCLQPHTQKVIPRGEWHCARCLSLCNGKPLPPKYGRVMRSISTTKAPSSMALGQSNTSGAQSSSEKKAGNPEAKVNHPKVLENGRSGLQALAVPGTAVNSVQPASDPKIPNGKNLSSSGKQIDQGASSGTFTDNEPSVHPQITESSTNEGKGDIESKSQPSDTLSNANMEGSDNPQSSDCMQNVEIEKQNSDIPLNENNEVKSTVEDAGEAHIEADGDCGAEIKQCKQELTCEDSASSEVTNHAKVSSDSLHDFEWIGNVIQAGEEKKLYQSCCIGGVTYKVHDHALFHLSSDKVVPSKLQAMWEDVKSGSKFVDIRRCYFPGDLPETVGRPYTPESNEVYESNNTITVLANLIRGPCGVLPITKFEEESAKRSLLGAEETKGLRPIFLCKWLYDEWKGSFQPVSG